MDIIRYEHQTEVFSSRLMDRYFGGMKVGVFDIETTGLNPLQTEVILAGIMSVEPDGKCNVTQFFADKKEDEEEVLTALYQELNKFNYIITYNGKHFDIPYIEKRAVAHGLENYRLGCYNLDLYLVLNGHSNLKKILPNLKQKTVEDYMGLNPDRADTISGAESVQLYESFLKEEDPAKKSALKAKVLLHNHDDLLQLYKVLPVIKQSDIHRAMSYLGFPVTAANNWPQLNVIKVRVDFSGLTISGAYGGEGFEYMSYDTAETPYSCHFQADGTFEFKLPVDKHKGSFFLNMRRFLSDSSEFDKYPNCINGFLLLLDKGSTNFMEMNMFTAAFLKEFMKGTPCPRTE